MTKRRKKSGRKSVRKAAFSRKHPRNRLGQFKRK